VIKDSPSALTWATAKNNFDVIKILLDRGGDVNIKGFIIEGEIMFLKMSRLVPFPEASHINISRYVPQPERE